MSYLIKNRDIVLSIRELNESTGEYDIEVGRTAFVAKTIKYNFLAKGSEFYGIKQADTLQWYSSEITFNISGDSYISPFTLPTPINSDDHIKNIYELYKSKFYENKFELGKNKFFLQINNCPLGINLFSGIVTNFDCDESDERLGLFIYNISFTGKPKQEDKVNEGIVGYLKDAALKIPGTLGF